ncbi:MAG: glutathione peroxidase [Moraxella sp.]|nr:glutathione peroxidase [Moraxella sp.]
MTTIYGFSANDLLGNVVNFADFKGKVLLIVNTASECGLTPQFAGLETLHKTYHDKGLVVIGFPCNQFGRQEPNDGMAIGEFCQRNYGVSFLMMDKINVNGDDAHPLYQWLKSEQSGLLLSAIKWNFTKFLIGRDGQVLHRYAPTTEPTALAADIEKALG